MAEADVAGVEVEVTEIMDDITGEDADTTVAAGTVGDAGMVAGMAGVAVTAG